MVLVREVFGKSYNDKLMCARDGRWSRWESVAKRQDYSARRTEGDNETGEQRCRHRC